MELSLSGSLSVGGIVLASMLGSQAHAYETCHASAQKSNEVIISQRYNGTCDMISAGSQSYTIVNVDSVATNAQGEKRVCGGFKTPTGYTVKRSEVGMCQTADYIVKNGSPNNQVFAESISKNGSLSKTFTTTDPDGDVLRYSAPSTGKSWKGGAVSVNVTTGYTQYTPPSETFEGKDDFSVHVSDGKGGNARIDIYVTVGEVSSGNRAPEFYLYSIVAEQNEKSGFQISATDPDGDGVTISVNQSLLPKHGLVRYEAGSGSYMVFSYTAEADYLGADEIGFIATDSKGANTYGKFQVQVVFTDSDGDGMPDRWEGRYGLNYLSAADKNGDSDNDGLTNYLEFINKTNPNLADTDGDTIPDGYEVLNAGFSPLDASDALKDFDGDGFSNLQEYLDGTDPINKADNRNTPLAAWMAPIIRHVLR